MLTPNNLQAVINDVSSIYSKVESTCIKSIAKTLGSRKDIKDIDKWRLSKLNQVGALRKELLREITRESRLAYAEVEQEIMSALRTSYFSDNKILKQIGNELTWEQVQKTPQFQRIINQTLKTVTNSLNYTGTTALEAGIAQYKQAINTAYLEVLAGASSIYDSVKNACKTLGGGGIKLNYGFDKIGRPVTCSLDSAIKRDIVTTINKASAELTIENCTDLDCDLVETTWHYGARPEHEVWQGKVFSISGKSTKYPPLSETGYGEVDGLCGINCRHSFYPYDEDVGHTTQEGKPTAEENRKAYELEQKQRYYERSLRGLKYQQEALLAGGFQEEAQFVQARINRTTANYKQFVTDNNLQRMTLNERVSGYHAISTGLGGNKTTTNQIDKVLNDTPTSKVGTQVVDSLKRVGIDYKQVQSLKKPDSLEGIVSKIGGLDKTTGSCASLALTYAGQKNGLDVIDYRGGSSMNFFSHRSNTINIGKLDNVKSWVVINKNDYSAVKSLLANTEVGKEYILGTGCHCSVIKRLETGYQYLELQNKSELNGFQHLGNEELKYRFGCKKSRKYEVPNVLIDIDTLKNNNDFRIVLGYVNTNSNAQMKGIGGSVK